MTYHGYTVDPKFVSGGDLVWKATGANGEIIIGTKDGKKYFIKRNLNARKADRDAAPEMRKSYEEKCAFIETKQKELKRLMSGLTVDGDHVVIEEEHFWDERDGIFVTVTRFMEGAIDEHYDFSKESVDVKRDIFTQMAKLIGLLHEHRVIHGDLKEGNFLFRRKGSGFELFVIDFDSSYPQDNIPTPFRIPYTPGYESPEILIYQSVEDETDTSRSFLMTPKTDIFTLGVIFHKIWNGKLPGFDSEDATLGLAIASSPDVKIMFDSSLNTLIGKGSGATYISLLNWMLQRDPDDRPTCQQVVEVLEDRQIIPAKFVIGDDVAPFTGLWVEHRNLAEYNEEDIKSQGFTSFQKNNSSGLKYLLRKDTEEFTYTIQELLDLGILKPKALELDEPWPEDKITFASAEVIQSNMISSIRRTENSLGNKLYEVIDIRGGKAYRSAKSLVNQGIASFIIESPTDEFGEPWPEDNALYAPKSFLESKKISKISTVEVGGIHAYEITYSDGREPKVLPGNTMLLLGYLVKKR